MPILNDNLPTSATGAFSPLRSNLEDMILSCGSLDKHIAMMNEDKETFGLLTEDTYCYDAPVRSQPCGTRMLPILIHSFRKYLAISKRSHELRLFALGTSA
jgi:hypothetical protein